VNVAATGVPAVVERLRPVAIAMAVLGLVGVAIGYGTGKEVAMQGYLYGFLFWMCVTLGCLGLTILLHTIRASWGIPVLRMFEAGGSVASLVLMALAGAVVAKVAMWPVLVPMCLARKVTALSLIPFGWLKKEDWDPWPEAWHGRVENVGMMVGVVLAIGSWVVFLWW